EYECRRAVMLDQSRYFEEQRSLCVASEPVWAAEGVLLAHTGNREWLTRKTCQQNVVSWYLRRRDLGDVTSDIFVAAEVRTVGLLRVAIPFGCERATSTDTLEAEPESTDTSEQVNESEPVLLGGGGGECSFRKPFDNRLRRRRVS